MMESSSEDGFGAVITQFKDYVLSSMPALGLTVSLVEAEGDHRVKVAGKLEGGAMEKPVLVEARQQKRKVGSHNLVVFKGEMDGKSIGDGIYISTSGFTEDALEYSVANNIRLLTLEDLERLKSPADRSAKAGRNIFERVYSLTMPPEGAKVEFERRRRKPFLGWIGDDERVDYVEGRYAPVGRFRLRRRGEPRLGLILGRFPEGESTLHINLSTCELYYMYLGIGGRGASIRSSNLLRRMMDLPENAVRILSEVVEQEDLSLEKLSPENQAFLRENSNSLAMLYNLGLIGVRRDGRGYLSNINLPRFADPRYDLGRFLSVEESVESDFGPDRVMYPTRGLLELLKDLFSCEGEFLGVTYLPYYVCRYATSDGRARFETHYGVAIKNG